MEPWLEVATKFGLPVAGFAILAWVMGRFLSKTLWPWMVAQLDKAQTAREKDLDRFATQIKEIGEEQTQAIRELSNEIRARRRG